MNFDLHLYGETPEELLNVLAHLGRMDSNYHTPIPDERHPAQLPPSRKSPHRSPQRHLWRSSRRRTRPGRMRSARTS